MRAQQPLTSVLEGGLCKRGGVSFGPTLTGSESQRLHVIAGRSWAK